MSKNLNFARENRADGGGERARQRNLKSAIFHALSNSEIYTSEYISNAFSIVSITDELFRVLCPGAPNTTLWSLTSTS